MKRKRLVLMSVAVCALVLGITAAAQRRGDRPRGAERPTAEDHLPATGTPSSGQIGLPVPVSLASAEAPAVALSGGSQGQVAAIGLIPGVLPPGTDAEPPGMDVSSEPLPPATAAHLNGLDALSAARWTQAIDGFSKAIEGEPDDVTYCRARGVANTLAENFQAAIADLRRANQLNPADTEARIWLAAAVQMSGTAQREPGPWTPARPGVNAIYQAAQIYVVASTDPYVSFVGQLRVDYGNYAFFKAQADQDAANGQADTSGQTQNHLKQVAAAKEAAKQRFPQAAAWYVSRMQTDPKLTAVLFQRAKQRFQQQQFPGARTDLEAVKTNNSKDMAVVYYHACCLLAGGDVLGAWVELTEVLTGFPSFGRAYAARAEASARMCDARRARTDLDLAVSLRPGDTDSFAARINNVLGQLKPDVPAEKPEVLRKQLEQAASGSEALAALVTRAVAVCQAERGRSLSEDEVYQERLKTLQDAVRSQPNDAAPLVAFSEFLTNEAQARYERRAPSGQFRILRLEVPRDPEGEFARADRLADAALGIDAKNARAMVAKARVAFAFSRFGDAEKLLQQALAIDRTVPDGLELEARVLTIGANQAEARAEALSTPQTGVDYGPDTIIYWTRYPTAEELRAAEEFRALAQQRLQEARQVFEEATRLRPTDATGWYDLGIWRLSQKDLPGAQVALEKAVQLKPKLLRGHQALAKVYADQGLADKANQEQSLSIDQVEGSVSDLLADAWNQMARTALKTAEQRLTLAASADPADARVPAYRAIIGLAQQQPAQGLTEFRFSTALEQARLVPRRMTGTETAADPCNPDEVALLMQLRLKLAELLIGQGRPADALPLCQMNLSFEGRLPHGSELQKLPTSLLPVVNLPLGQPRPVPENPTSLLAWSHYDSGQALQALGRGDEATAQYQAAYMAGRSLPPIIGIEPVFKPRVRAGIAMAKIVYARGDVQSAQTILQKVFSEAQTTEDRDEAEKLRESMTQP